MSPSFRLRLLLPTLGLLVATTAPACTSDESEQSERETNQTPPTDNDDTSEDPPEDTGDTSDTGDAGDSGGLEIPDESDAPDCPTSADEPRGLLLTWQRDPTSTMTVDWHTDGEDSGERTSLCFRPADVDYWTHKRQADSQQTPYLDRTLHRTEITNLEPDTEYVFQVGEFDREYRFRTMPADIDDEPLEFVTGGDTQFFPELFESTNEVVMQRDLDFILLGGDLSYADGGDRLSHEQRWQWWFETVKETLIYDDGRVLPIITTLGNHEVQTGYVYNDRNYEQTDERRRWLAPYFYTYFAFPGQPGYDVLDFGNYLSIVFLDSNHTNPIEGAQTEWFESVLENRRDRGVDHILPIYHVPAYPSHRDFEGQSSVDVREHWVPLFEEYDLPLAFEHHDHTYKRTHPLRDGEIDEENGVTYIGDGAWGVFPRPGQNSDAWYLREFENTLHAIFVTIQNDVWHLESVSAEGETLDEHSP